MPRGRIKWLDEKTGEGRIQGNSEFAVRTEDVEPDARAPGARVQFDILRDAGVARAVNVRLREGTRSSPKQSRFGDLSGAKHPDRAGRQGLTRQHPDRVRELDPHQAHEPEDVVRKWAQAIKRGDHSTLLPLYAPDAQVHTAEGTLRGPDAIQGYLSGRPLGQMWEGDFEVLGDRGEIVLRGVPLRQEDPPREVRFRVAHGHIVEQWVPE